MPSPPPFPSPSWARGAAWQGGTANGHLNLENLEILENSDTLGMPILESAENLEFGKVQILEGAREGDGEGGRGHANGHLNLENLEILENSDTLGMPILERVENLEFGKIQTL